MHESQSVLPNYWLPRPYAATGSEVEAAFDALVRTYVNRGGCPAIQFDLPFPKWQFLCYLAERHDIALHGSGNPDIALFEPRHSNDFNAFGSQKAVYAAADGIWAMFFAIVDRDRFELSVNNACIRLVDESGNSSGPHYLFSISQSALPLQPWRTGTVYLLPRDTFIAQPPVPIGSNEVQIPQLASLLPVQPLAKLVVTPTDFPFLMQIRGHDDQRLQEYATALQSGAPWPDGAQ